MYTRKSSSLRHEVKLRSKDLAETVPSLEMKGRLTNERGNERLGHVSGGGGGGGSSTWLAWHHPLGEHW